MIYKDNKPTTGVFTKGKVITAVYKGAQLVWSLISHLSAWFRSEGYFRSEPW